MNKIKEIYGFKDVKEIKFIGNTLCLYLKEDMDIKMGDEVCVKDVFESIYKNGIYGTVDNKRKIKKDGTIYISVSVDYNKSRKGIMIHEWHKKNGISEIYYKGISIQVGRNIFCVDKKANNFYYRYTDYKCLPVDWDLMPGIKDERSARNEALVMVKSLIRCDIIDVTLSR